MRLDLICPDNDDFMLQNYKQLKQQLIFLDIKKTYLQSSRPARARAKQPIRLPYLPLSVPHYERILS